MSRYIDADLLMPNAEHKGRYDVVSAYDIANTPTADVRENVHGEWIDDYDPVNFGEFRYKCSKCGARTVEWADNFCFNCGADMRERRTDGEQSD